MSNSNAASTIRGPTPGLPSRRAPAQPAGNHQVQDKEELVVEAEHDPLAEPLDSRRTMRPCTTAIGGSTDRSTNGLSSNSRCRG